MCAEEEAEGANGLGNRFEFGALNSVFIARTRFSEFGANA